MLKYQAERNLANNVDELRGKYNLRLNDENVCNITCHVEKNGTWWNQGCGIPFTD